jgi:hypothetical protein
MKFSWIKLNLGFKGYGKWNHVIFSRLCDVTEQEVSNIRWFNFLLRLILRGKKYLDDTASDGRMRDELERIWKEVILVTSL